MTDFKSDKSAADPLAQLKEILLTDDQQRIQDLEAELEKLREQINEKDRLIKTMEPVITDILDYKIANSKDQMAKSLAPVMSEAIKRQVSEARDDVVDALYPVVGRMVTKAVTEAMKKLTAQINESLNKTFDFSLWKTRIKAKVFGINAGEMLIAGAAEFDLQQIFLISRQSGLLLGYASRSEQENVDQEAQVIGGMLTAIKSFVETSFANGGEGDLREIEHSNRTIRIDSGLHTYLAAVYSGVPAPGFDEQLKACHLKIHRKFHKKLRSYAGDNSVLKGIDAPMREILKTIPVVQHD